MTTIFKVEEKIIECKSKDEVFLSEDEYANVLLESISSVSKFIICLSDHS